MNISLIVVSDSLGLRRFLGDTKSTIFPPNSLKKGHISKFKVNVQINAINPTDLQNTMDLERLVLRRSDAAHFVILMIDESRAQLAYNIRNAALVDVIISEDAEKSPQNYLWFRLARIVKVINYLVPLFGTAPDYEILALPLRNFVSAELQEICEIVSGISTEPDFVAAIDARLKLIRRRVRPRARTNYPTLYAVDDKQRFFKFGKERHSRPETGKGHQPYCAVNSLFRFGARIDNLRHYNVSQGDGDNTFVSDIYCNCHGELKMERMKPGHLNMFSNDHY